MAFGLLNKFLGPSEASIRKEISEVVPISECSVECGDCTVKFPSSVKTQDDDGAPLWKSTKPYDLHCVVPTGKTDWPHDATSVPNTIQNKVAEWGSSSKARDIVGGGIKVTVSSLPVDDSNIAAVEGTVGSVLLLPYFVWVRNCHMDKIDSVLDELVPLLKQKRSQHERSIPDSIAGTKIEVDKFKAHVFFCSHRTRDKRCGITAPIMKKEMDHYLRDLDLLRDFGDDRADGVCVSFINHVGGHKFSANVIIYLKTGENVWLARCSPNNIKPIVDETILGGGKVWPEKVRLVQRTDPISW